MICLNCSTKFEPSKTNAKFCSTKCRTAHWKNNQIPTERKTFDNQSVAELKQALTVQIVEAHKIIKSFDRLFKEFDEWQIVTSDIVTRLEDNREAAAQQEIDDLIKFD